MDYDLGESGLLAFEYDVIESSKKLPALTLWDDINQLIDPDYRRINAI